MSASDHTPPPGSPGPGAPKSWRSKGKPKSITKRQRWQEDWVKKDQRSAAAKVWTHRFKVGGATVLLMALVALLIWWIIPQNPRTPFIGFAVTQSYPAPIPPNAWAHEDLRAFGELHGKGGTLDVANLSVDWNKSLAKGKEALERKLAEFSGRHKPMIIYVSMHGLVNDQGEPSLLPAGHFSPNTDDWLTLADLLSMIASGLSERAQKLLVLDCTRIEADWRLGILYNSFSELLPAAVHKAGVPNLVVLSASSPGERAWTSPDDGYSVFGRYLFTGLRGDADQRAFGGNEDKSVTLKELYGYVRSNVENWAAQKRAAVQRPVLIYSGADESAADTEMELAQISRFPALPAVSFEPPVAEGDFSNLWKSHERLRSESQHRQHDPQEWQTFEQLLLTMEEWNRSGAAYQDAASKALAKARGLRDQLQQPEPRKHIVHSLKLADRMHGARNENDYFTEARKVWAGFIAMPTLESARRALGAVGSGARPGVIEVHFLRMLLEHLERTTAWADPGAVSQAVALRELAEDAAAPADERAQYQVRAIVERGDQHRRIAEDFLFSDLLDRAKQEWSNAKKDYEIANSTRTVVQDAFLLRDRALADLRAYAWWLARRVPLGLSGKASSNDDTVNTTLLPLIADIRELSDLLDAADVDGSGIQKIQQIVDRALPRLGKLGAEYQTEVQNHLTSAVNQTNLMEIAALLEVPLVSGAQRSTLLKRYADDSGQLAQRTGDVSGTGEANHPANDTETFDRMSHWENHPVLALLALPSGGRLGETQWSLNATNDPAERAKQFGRYNNQTRKWLFDDGPKQVNDWLEQTTTAMADNRISPVDARRGRSLADRYTRAMWALHAWAFRSSTPAARPPSPTAALRTLDLHNLLVWHGHRTADDFWGPADPQDISGNSFFYLAGRSYWNSAKELCQATGDSELEQALSAQLNRAKQFSPPKAGHLLRIDEVADRLPVDVAVDSAGAVQGQANATASVALRKNGSADSLPFQLPGDVQRSDYRRFQLPLDGSNKWTTLLDHQDLGNDEAHLEAVWRFRGHMRSHPFDWLPKPDFRLEDKLTDLSPPRVTVHGSAIRSAVLFILDCSGSMKAKEEGQDLTRFELALNNLTPILDEFATNNMHHVGMMVYGHRFQQFAQLPDKNEAIRRIGEDVEPILTPVGGFGLRELQQVKRRLVDISPDSGWTPLYYALTLALRPEEWRGAEGRQKSIVVITDGQNNQKNHPAPTTLNDVRKAWINNKIRINLFEFLIPAEDNEALTEFRSFVERDTEGTIASVKRAEELLKQLQATFHLNYEVVPDGEKPIAAKLERSVYVAPDRHYQAHLSANPLVRSGRFNAERGHDLHIEVADDEKSLKFRRFERFEDRDLRPTFRDSEGSSRFRFGLHTPLPLADAANGAEGGVRFRFSVQDAAGGFTPSPSQLWTRIVPVNAAGPIERAYPFFHTAWVDKRQVPEWYCDVPAWPNGADQAEISIWCVFGDAQPDKRVRLGDVSGQTVTIAEAPDATFEVRIEQDPLRVVVVEQKSQAAVLVSLAPPHGTVKGRISRRYYTQAHSAAHLFVFEGITRQELENYTFELTSQNSLQKRSEYVQKVRISAKTDGPGVRLD